MFKLRRFGIKLKRSEWKVLRWLLARPASWLVTLGQRILSKKLLLSCEVAMEYLLALTNSPQVCHSSHCHVTFSSAPAILSLMCCCLLLRALVQQML